MPTGPRSNPTFSCSPPKTSRLFQNAIKRLTLASQLLHAARETLNGLVTGGRPATFVRRGVSASVRVGRAIRRDRHAVTSQFVDQAPTTGWLPPRTAPEPPTATGNWR